MGFADLMQHMSMERQPDRLRRRAQTTYGLVASRDNNNNVSPCLQEADSQGGEAQMPRLPEVRHDIFSMVGCATEMSVNHVSRWLPNPCFFPTGVHN